MHKLRSEYGEAINLYSEALQVYTDFGDRRERALTLWGLGEVRRFQHQFSEATDLYMEAVQIFTDVGDLKEKALTLWSLADGYRVQDRYSEASKFFSESRQIYTDIADRQGRGMACGASPKSTGPYTNTVRPPSSTQRSYRFSPTSATNIGEPKLY